MNMKILICSDSHRHNEALEEIIKLHPHMDLYLHAGDSEAYPHEIEPFISVKGNCDYYFDYPERRIIPTPMGNLLIQHHPELPKQLIKKYDVKIFIHGHTHVRKYQKEGNLIVINPGAISYSRDKYSCSYAILNIDDESCKIKFMQLD